MKETGISFLSLFFCFRMKLTIVRIVIAGMFVSIFCSSLFAQENTTVLWEPAIQIEYRLGNGYRHEFAFEKRSFVYNDNAADFKVNLMDIEHFSIWNLPSNQTLALGLQYRFEEPFVEEENEFRTTQQYTYTHGSNPLNWEHRLRAEQRIQPSRTAHRFRYRLQATKPLGEQTSMRLNFLIESLATFTPSLAPSWEQRASSTLQFTWKDFIEIETGLEYRLGDYTGTPTHEIFIISGATFSWL
jgi:hypothetical protein